MELISVNEAIDRLDELDSSIVSIYGVLELGLEGNVIFHVPKSEQRINEFANDSCLKVWLDVSLHKERDTKSAQLDGRHVKITGKLTGPNPELFHEDEISTHPEIFINDIEKFIIKNRRHLK